MDIEYRITF